MSHKDKRGGGPPMFKMDSSSCMVLREAFPKLGNLVKVCCSTRVQAWPTIEPNTLIPIMYKECTHHALVLLRKVKDKS